MVNMKLQCTNSLVYVKEILCALLIFRYAGKGILLAFLLQTVSSPALRWTILLTVALYLPDITMFISNVLHSDILCILGIRNQFLISGRSTIAGSIYEDQAKLYFFKCCNKYKSYSWTHCTF